MRTLSAVMALVLVSAGSAQERGLASPSLLKTALSRLPVYFIENRGVYPDEVRFSIQGADRTLFFSHDGITFRLTDDARAWVVKLEFVGANPDAVPRGESRQAAVFSYFKGPPKEWKTGLGTFARVVYENLWPGIDLVYHGDVQRLKYEFVVSPGADPKAIRLRYRGATSVAITRAGGLRVTTPAGSFEDEPPVAWQRSGEGRVPVETTFAPGDGDDRSFGFRVGRYDRGRPLVLDPALLVYCGYIGGSSTDRGHSIAVDAAGNAYVTGWTSSSHQTFPVTVGPDPTFNAIQDVFVAKVNPQGTGLVYCGYIGGASYDFGEGIDVDSAGNAYVTGYTRSDQLSFPVTVGPGLTHKGSYDAFVAKVNAAGTGLVYCGYIGGASTDNGYDIAVDAAGSAYVAGTAFSDQTTFPVTVGPVLTHTRKADGFVAKVNAAGTGLVYCGYIGGFNTDYAQGIAVDPAGHAYVIGYTDSDQTTFPVKVGPDLTHNASDDTFVAKVNPQGTGFVYCGFVGGSGADYGEDVAADAAGNAYVTGRTMSDEQTFPVKVGPDLTHNGGNDVFVAKIDPQGTAFVYCGYIGGSGNDSGYGIAVDAAGNAYVAGLAASDEQTFPVLGGPDLTHNGGDDGFAAIVNPAGTGLVSCGYIGGSAHESAYGIAVDAAGNAFVVGRTPSNQSTFPVTVGPDLTHNGGNDVFVARISITALAGSGAPNPGGRVDLSLTASGDAGLPYQVGSSLGTGPIPIDTRMLGLSQDDLLLVSVRGFWPAIFSGYQGILDGRGRATAAIRIPNLPLLVGTRIHTAFLTLDPSAPSGIKSISNTFSFSIAK